MLLKSSQSYHHRYNFNVIFYITYWYTITNILILQIYAAHFFVQLCVWFFSQNARKYEKVQGKNEKLKGFGSRLLRKMPIFGKSFLLHQKISELCAEMEAEKNSWKQKNSNALKIYFLEKDFSEPTFQDSVQTILLFLVRHVTL